jgi:HEPN domain-containing protein
VTPQGSARYRLDLAKHSLAGARDNLDRSNWRDAALFARAAVEHGAMLASFSAVPRAHEPSAVLRAALAAPRFPDPLRERAAALMPELERLGAREHIELSYGDEEHGIDPWSLVTEPRATHHVDVAQRVVALARECWDGLFEPRQG